MKVLAYCPILYGKEYLREAILAVHPVVDRIIFLYTAVGSYGHHAGSPCPETEEELKAIALSFPKCEWISGRYDNEGQHRSSIFNFVKDEDLVLAFDADEVIDTADLRKALKVAINSGKRNHGVNGYVNFWRNFSQVVEDGFRPVRIINPHAQNTDQAEVKMKVYHFGCCQNREIMRYKWQVHGHKAELRANWLDEVYFNEACKETMHPASFDVWKDIQPFDKTSLPEILKRHPNYNKAFV